MALAGVPFTPKDIEDAIYKYNGKITAIAKHYKVIRNTIYEYIKKHPELNELIEIARSWQDDKLIEKAECVMEAGLDKVDSDYKEAFQAAKYILDNKGHKRGWGTDGKPQHEKAVDNQLGTLIGQSEEIYRKMKEDQK